MPIMEEVDPERRPRRERRLVRRLPNLGGGRRGCRNQRRVQREIEFHVPASKLGENIARRDIDRTAGSAGPLKPRYFVRTKAVQF
jgi:hypothetical protein